MGTWCERCRRRDEQDYRNLDDCQKHLLLLMMGDFQHEITIPKEFVQRLKGDIPEEIQLETHNRNSYTVRVDKSQEKVIFAAGWAQFVKTFDLRMGDSMMFRFKGNSQFDVIIFDQVGREKVCSVAVDDYLDPNVQEGRTDATETLNSSRAHSQDDYLDPNVQEGRTNATETLNSSRAHSQPMPMQTPATETLNSSRAHPQPMPMQLPTETVNHFHAPHYPMQMPIENMALSRTQAMPTQMQSPPTYRWTQVQRDNLRYSLPSEDQGCRVGVIPDPIIGRRTKLNPVQEKVVNFKIQHIHSEIPIFVAVIKRSNVSGVLSTLSVAKRYVDEYLGGERFISLSRLGGKWGIRLAGGGGSGTRMVGGWQKFVNENDFGVGDICLFELLKNHKGTMEVHIIKAKDIF
uniref:TF-B3 domain-containing protein n=1 Tax=Oryza nivara TaxID=4536 RepID=A0A0E0IA98_ORYNI